MSNETLDAEYTSGSGGKTTVVKKTVKEGASFGTVLAVVISYVHWHSVGWAIVHGLLSWVYVIYHVIRY